MNVSIEHGIDRLLELRSKADDIADETHPGALFASGAFYRAYWSVYGEGLELHTLVVEQGGQVLGLAPLVTGEGGWNSGTRLNLELLGAHVCDFSYFPGCETPAVVGALVDFLESWKGKWATIWFPFIADGSCLRVAVAADRRGLHALSRIADVNHWLELQPGSASEVPEFPANRTLRNQMHRLRRVSEFTLVEHTEPESILRRLPHLMHLHVLRWSNTETPSKFRSLSSRDFYSRLTAELGHQGSVLFELVWDGRSIAYIYGFRRPGRYLLHTSAVDLTLRQNSPGTLIYHLLVNHVSRQGECRIIDYMRGDERYKLTKSNSSAPLWDIRWYSRKPDWLLQKTRIGARSVAKQALARVPVLQDAALGWRRTWRTRRGAVGSTKTVHRGSTDLRIVSHRLRRRVPTSEDSDRDGVQWQRLTADDQPKLESFFGEPSSRAALGLVRNLWQSQWWSSALLDHGNVMALSMHRPGGHLTAAEEGAGSTTDIPILAPMVSPIWAASDMECRVFRLLVEHVSALSEHGDLILLTTNREVPDWLAGEITAGIAPSRGAAKGENWPTDVLGFLSLRL